jgi:hypothetical protein
VGDALRTAALSRKGLVDVRVALELAVGQGEHPRSIVTAAFPTKAKPLLFEPAPPGGPRSRTSHRPAPRSELGPDLGLDLGLDLAFGLGRPRLSPRLQSPMLRELTGWQEAARARTSSTRSRSRCGSWSSARRSSTFTAPSPFTSSDAPREAAAGRCPGVPIQRPNAPFDCAGVSESAPSRLVSIEANVPTAVAAYFQR